MSKKCELTGKIPLKGHNVSHANNKTKRRFLPNLKKVKFTSKILKRNLRLNVSNAAVRSVDKKGSFDLFLKDVKSKNLSNVPFLSTDLTPALHTVSFKLLFKRSLVNLTFFKLGKNLLLVLLLA